MAEWDETRIRALFDTKTPEDWHLDYKSADVFNKSRSELVATLTKEVSGFANADGGVIIVGMEATGPRNRRLPTKIAGAAVGPYQSEWLSQLIGGNISPTFPELNVIGVPLTDDHEGEEVFMISTLRSTFAVQASDFKFYQRSDDRTEPMRGYQVQDVNNRSIGPDLIIRFGFPEQRIRTEPPYHRLQLWTFVINRSRVPAEFAVVKVGLPSVLTQGRANEFGRIPTEQVRLQGSDGTQRILTVYTANYYASDATPPIIAQPSPTRLSPFDMRLAEDDRVEDHEPLVWATYSPRMEPRFGVSWIKSFPGGDAHKASMADAVDIPEISITLDGMSPEEYWRRPA